MDIIDGTGFWVIGDGTATPPTPTPPAQVAPPPFAGAGPIHTLYRAGTVPNDFAALLIVLLDD